MPSTPAIDTELLREALGARERQIAELRAALADATSDRDLAVDDARSHEREANAQRERADAVEREANAQRERADAVEREANAQRERADALAAHWSRRLRRRGRA